MDSALTAKVTDLRGYGQHFRKGVEGGERHPRTLRADKEASRGIL